MANVEPGLKRLGKHHYSIRQLLALSGHAYMPFDLSKFSFDAARAGVIPSLGECAMASRKSSATRQRISSTETASTLGDVVVFQGNETKPAQRHPRPPPATILAQQHIGFARFLKKHTSPTHQRVTAGGRIVPMEPREAPPPFRIDALDQNRNSQASYAPENTKFTNVSYGVAAGRAGIPQVKPAVTTQPLFRPLNNEMDNTFSRTAPHTRDEQEQMPYNAPAPLLGENSNVPWLQALYPVAENVPALYPTCLPPVQSAYGVFPALYAPHGPLMYPTIGGWPMSTGTVSAATQAQPAGSSHLAQPISWAYSALAEWSQRYNELDQQLKSLDRHRAMTNLSAEIVNQRRDIVQQRSDSKNMMNQISTWLASTAQVHSDVNAQSFVPAFNVDAPAYVPLAQQQMASSMAMPAISNTGINESNVLIQKPPPRSARRPIAIVAPNKVETGLQQDQSEDEFSPESPGRGLVDSWGSKIGRAPAELRKQQSEILEAINEASSEISRSNQSQESLQSAPHGGFFGKFMNGDVEDPSAEGATQVESEHAPSVVEDMYEDGLDALRMPTGTVTAVKMPDGTTFDVEGQDLQCPDPSTMSQFEQDYWSRKPTLEDAITEEGLHNESSLRRYMTATPTSQMIVPNPSEHSGSGLSERKENVALVNAVHRKAATDVVHERIDGGRHMNAEFQSSQSLGSPYRGQDGYLLPHVQPTEHSQLQRSRFGAGKYFNRSEVAFPTTLASDTYVSGNFDQPHATHHDLVSRTKNASSEGLNNKGYSSISIQNVNAVAQLPQNMDGAMDSGRQSKSIFSLVGRVKSPRILRRTAAHGGAWYGPHCREVIERALICDHEEPRRQSPKRASD